MCAPGANLGKKIKKIKIKIKVNELPLYPNESLLWDENLVPLGQFYGGKVMALPKLNLQFLTSHDYLLR